MEMKLEKLIEKIKSEGVAAAEKEGKEILKKAHQEADAFLEETRGQAEKIINAAETEANKLRANAESALHQAERDSVLLVKTQLIQLFNRVLKQEIARNLDPELLQEIISKMLLHWQKEHKVEFMLNEKDAEQLKRLVLNKTKENLKEGIQFKVDKGISKGFRIRLEDQDLYYDFTDESIAEFLEEFLNPALRSMLHKKNG
jgi:V/A-type H+-transporting ATPase subunit E